jgi:hypothetical protein
MNMKVRAFVIGFLLCGIFVSIATSEGSAQNPPCGCEDKADLLEQLKIADAALAKIAELQKTFKLTDQLNELEPEPNPGRQTKKNSIDQALSGAVGQVKGKNWGVHLVRANEITCTGEFQPGTPCLVSLFRNLAQVQAEICFSDKKKYNVGKGGSSLEVMTVGGYLSSRSEYYRRAVSEILRLLRALPSKCVPGDWFGMIRYTELREMNTKESAKGREESSQDTLTRSGTITLTGTAEGNPFSSWEAGGKHKETKDTTGTMFCTASDRWAKKETPYETHFKVEFERNGATSLNMEVAIGEVEEGNLVLISFQIPRMNVMMTGKTTDTRTSGCPGDNINNNIPLSTDTVFESSRFNFKGRYFSGDPEKISGSETIDEIPAVKTDRLTMSNTVQVSYSLYKLRR